MTPEIELEVIPDEDLTLEVASDQEDVPVESVEVVRTGGGGGTSDYNDLSNKPQINGVTLSGNKSLSDLGIAAATDIPAVDSTLSGSSTNAIQNKAVYDAFVLAGQAIDAKADPSDIPSPSDSTPEDLNTTPSAGDSDDYARANHVHRMPSANDVGAIPTPSNPSIGDFLCYTANGWDAVTVPSANGVSF